MGMAYYNSLFTSISHWQLVHKHLDPTWIPPTLHNLHRTALTMKKNEFDKLARWKKEYRKPFEWRWKRVHPSLPVIPLWGSVFGALNTWESPWNWFKKSQLCGLQTTVGDGFKDFWNFHPTSLGFHDPIWRERILFKWVGKKNTNWTPPKN